MKVDRIHARTIGIKQLIKVDHEEQTALYKDYIIYVLSILMERMIHLGDQGDSLRLAVVVQQAMGQLYLSMIFFFIFPVLWCLSACRVSPTS